jgi:hypothetical protein
MINQLSGVISPVTMDDNRALDVCVLELPTMR